MTTFDGSGLHMLLRLYDWDGSGLAGIPPSKLRWSGRFVDCARCGGRFFSAGRAFQKPDGSWVVKRNWAGAANRCPSCEIELLATPPAKPWADTPARTLLGAALLAALLVMALAGCSVDGELQQGYIQGQQQLYQWECFRTDAAAACTAVAEDECETQPGCRWGYIERATPTINDETTCIGIHRDGNGLGSVEMFACQK